MKRKQSIMTVVALILVASMLFPFAACVKTDVTNVELDRSSLMLDVGESTTLSTMIFPANATIQTAVWRSSDSNVATVDNNGKVTGVAEGKATVKVSVDGVEATCSVTVYDSSKRAVDVTGITLNPTSLSLTNENNTATITATVAPENATDKTLTWTSSDDKVAKVQNGVVTAVGAGTAIVTAVSTNNVRATCFVSVSGTFTNPDDGTVSVTSVAVDPDELTLLVGATSQLTATVSPEDATNKAVNWSSDNEDVAVVDDTGKVAAVSSGTAIITVTTEDGSKTATCTVMVIEPVTGVTVAPGTLALTVGASGQLTATIEPSDATNQNVTWSSDNKAVATVDDNGKVTAVSAGTATITVTTKDGNKTAKCVVTVTQSVEGVTVVPATLSLKVGEFGQLTATVSPSNATNKDVTWTSTNPAVAKVDETGKVEAVSLGTATIIVTTADGGKIAECFVSVVQPVTGVTVAPTEISLVVGRSSQLSATIEPANATNKAVTWSSDDESVAEVDENGIITAKAAGTATITVTTKDGGKTAQCVVTVRESSSDDVSVTGVSLNKTELALELLGEETLIATVEPSEATDKNVTWSSSNTAVATVDGTGKVTAVSVGTATITVKTSDGGFTAQCEVTVSYAATTAVAISTKTLTFNTVGAATKLSATVSPANANPTIIWASSDNNVVTVDGTGMVTVTGYGTATITATSTDGISDECAVTVSYAATTSITLNKTEITFTTLNSTSKLTATIVPSNANPNLTWTSSNTSVATVDNTGLVKVVGYGTATITVTSVDGVKAECTVTMNYKSATAVSISKTSLNFTSLGVTATLTATVRPSSANPAVTWTTSDPAVATVVDGVVTAIGYGTAIITATSADGLKSATCTVTVEKVEVTVTSDTLYVKPVSGLSNRTVDFIMGMDSSAVLSLEAAGVKYKNFDGQVQDVFQILKDNGITDIRIRVWNDPTDSQGRSYGGGNCDINNAVELAKRCAAVGLGVIVDFHYSDFWADPGKQTIPKAWKSYSTTQVASAIYEFTKQSLEKVKATGVHITMVQVGNETTSGIAGTFGWAANTATICNYINQGAKAVREVTGAVADGGAKVAVHFTDPQSHVYTTFAQYLNNYQVDYDVFGTSYYPYWHGTLENLSNQLSSVHNKYNKEVMVLETSYAFTYEEFDGTGNTPLATTPYPVSVQGQSNAVRAVIDTIASLGDWGLGVCYWEGTWIAASTEKSWSANAGGLCLKYGCGWASQYAHDYDSSAPTNGGGGCVIDNQAFFMSDGTPLESLKMFAMAKNGNTVALKADQYVDQEDYYTVGVGSITLPTTVTVTLNDGSTINNAEVTWNYTAEQLEQYINTVGEYTIVGTTKYGGACYFYIFVNNPNLLSGGSFESEDGIKGYGSTDNFIQSESELGGWKLSYEKGSSALQLYVSNDSGNARMGSQSFHFWDSATVNFKLYQMVDLSKLTQYGAGKYGCSFDIMGGDGANMDIHAYIKVTYNDGTEALTVTGDEVELTEWQDWHRTSATVQITDLSKVASIEVGISVYTEVSGNGPWGNIDNAQFFFA